MRPEVIPNHSDARAPEANFQTRSMGRTHGPDKFWNLVEIEVAAMRSERPVVLFPPPLLLKLDKLLAERERRGSPLNSITLKVKCEVLIPAVEHCTFWLPGRVWMRGA